MACKCKLKIKDGFNIILESEFLSRPVNLSKISESEYDFYSDFFPEAFEVNHICKVDSLEKVKKEVKDYSSSKKKKKN